MTLTQQEIFNHVQKHSGLSYLELFEDVGEPRGLNIMDVHETVQVLEKLGLVREEHTIPNGYVVVAA